MINYSKKPICYIVDPYNELGGGQVSQVNLCSSIELTNSFSQVIKYSLRGNLVFSSISFFKFIIKMNFNKCNKYVIIFQGIFEFQYLIADLFLRNKKRLIIIPRGAFVPFDRSNIFVKKPHLKIFLWNYFIKKRIANSGIWVSTSDLEQKRFLFIGAKLQNSLIIPDSFSINRLHNSSGVLLNKLIEKDYLLYVGRISQEKNILFLIEVINRLVQKGLNKKLIILGPISDISYYNLVIDKINMYSLNEFVIFRNSKLSLELNEYYINSCCVLLPSFIESFGLVVLEALQFKKVIFVSQNVPLNFISSEAGKQLNLDVEIWSDEIFNFCNQKNDFNADFNQIFNKFSIEKISLLWQNATNLLTDGRL
jgi:glycosyltransferase involved in cell wall biosynthesis